VGLYLFFYLTNIDTLDGKGHPKPPIWGWLSPTTFTVCFLIQCIIEETLKKRREKKTIDKDYL
jgi:hypothetical protein